MCHFNVPEKDEQLLVSSVAILFSVTPCELEEHGGEASVLVARVPVFLVGKNIQ